MITTERIQFKGYDGDMLDARLELPAKPARAFALFAHCFSCTKASLAASRISRRLAERGIAVLRFDFTGLGQSEGDFANTNFSSNVQDLIAAANWLIENHGACDLLVGHSLGGAACLVAANHLPDVKAVATIGSPADADHILHTLSSSLDTIEETGKAEVQIASERFTIKKQFVDDVREANVREGTAALHRPLMIMHSPLDEVVGIDNATELFIAAKHPKSFVSLDKADHMLSAREDSEFVADTLAAWAFGYVGKSHLPEEAAKIPREQMLVTETGEGPYANYYVTGDHVARVDEPEDRGGLDTGPTPTELLCAALGACTTITLRMYLNRKGWDATHISCQVRWLRNMEKDETGWAPVIFKREIAVQGNLTEDQRGRLEEIANKCPVHNILHHASTIETTIKEER